MQDKRETISTTMRSRKVIFDEYTHGFYVESRLETLKRQVDTRNNLTEVLNKSQDARCEFAKRQVDAAKRIFVRKSAMAKIIHKDNLQEYKAHLNVLQDIARKNQKEGLFDEDHGKYGIGSSKPEIQHLIEKKIKQNSPSAKRRRDVRRHLNHRSRVEVFDRSISTSALLKTTVKSRSPTKLSLKQSSAQLILPPISVSFSKKKNGKEIGNGVHISTRPATCGRYDDVNLPTVFVTQTRAVV